MVCLSIKPRFYDELAAHPRCFVAPRFVVPFMLPWVRCGAILAQVPVYVVATRGEERRKEQVLRVRAGALLVMAVREDVPFGTLSVCPSFAHIPGPEVIGVAARREGSEGAAVGASGEKRGAL